MGWNENIKKILDFIPIFERQVKANESLELRVKALESAKVEPIEYDDSELRKEIARFNELFDSFRRTEGEQSAIAIGRINKQVRELSRAIDNAPKPYDDSKLVDMINGIEKYDDTDINKEIETIKQSVEAINNIKPFDDSKLKSDIKKLSESVSKIKPYNDAAVKKSIKAINQTLIAIKPYDDKAVKKLISELSLKVSKMTSDHKKENSDKLKQLVKATPKPYDDSFISGRIEKQCEAIAELSDQVSKLNQLFEVD